VVRGPNVAVRFQSWKWLLVKFPTICENQPELFPADLVDFRRFYEENAAPFTFVRPTLNLPAAFKPG
jgi:hypothetical protein